MSDDPSHRPPDSAELALRIAELWAEFRGTMLARVAAMEEVPARLAAGTLDDEARRSAFMHAHKLAGSLGTFGLLEASREAQAIEKRLGGREPLEGADAAAIAEAALRIRLAVERGPGLPGGEAGAPPPGPHG